MRTGYSLLLTRLFHVFMTDCVTQLASLLNFLLKFFTGPMSYYMQQVLHVQMERNRKQ